jgi:hypothetical protein
VTLALLIIVLSGAAWASLPLLRVFVPVWVGTVALGTLGAVLFFASKRDATDRQICSNLLLFSIAVAIALGAMPSILHYGLGYFVSSVCLDGWSYAAVADYLTHVPRGVDSGLSALHQYGSHLAHVRNASSSILAHLALTFSTRADEVVALYCTIILFANACALAVFATTMFNRSTSVIVYVLIAGTAMPAFIISYANLDQLLLLPILPLAATAAARMSNGWRVGPGILFGILLAAGVMAYVEMAVLGLVVAASFIFAPNEKLVDAAKRTAMLVAISGPIAAVLSWPGLLPLFAMLNSQYASASQEALRPGEGMLANWVMRGDFLHIWWIAAPLAIVIALSAITIFGAWSERKRWPSVVSLVVVIALASYFLLYERYLYAVYKIVSVNFWMFCFFTAVGLERIAHRYRHEPISLNPRWVTAFFASLLLLAAWASTILDMRQRGTASLQKSYREAFAIAGIVGHEPILLSVVDHIANQWAVLYLSDAPMTIAPYRSTMSQAHVIPVMDRAKPVTRSNIRYLVTDSDDSLRPQVTGAIKAWSGGAYSLWKVTTPSWDFTPGKELMLSTKSE